jgi:hypothetical protein
MVMVVWSHLFGPKVRLSIILAEHIMAPRKQRETGRDGEENNPFKATPTVSYFLLPGPIS